MAVEIINYSQFLGKKSKLFSFHTGKNHSVDLKFNTSYPEYVLMMYNLLSTLSAIYSLATPADPGFGQGVREWLRPESGTEVPGKNIFADRA